MRPCGRGSPSSNCESQITNHESRPSLVRGTLPATPPCSYATVPARPQHARQPPGSNATVSARRQPIARPTSPHPPLQFLTTGHWQLTTGNCRAANPVPPFPARDSETCYTASLSPNTTRLDPNALHRTTARPPCRDRPPCRPAPYRTSESCPKRTSLRAQPLPTGNVPPCRPPRRQPAAEQDPPYSICRRRHHLDRYPVTRSTQLSLFCALSAPERHLLRTFSPKPTAN